LGPEGGNVAGGDDAGRDAHRTVGLDQAQPLRPDRRQARAARQDAHVLAGHCQARAEQAADGTRTHDAHAHGVNLECSLRWPTARSTPWRRSWPPTRRGRRWSPWTATSWTTTGWRPRWTRWRGRWPPPG